MKKITKSHNNISYYFVKSDSKLVENMVIDQDTILVRGEENLLTILNKTIVAMELCLRFNFQYLIRSNISTIVNVDALLSFLNSAPTFNYYSGGIVLNLTWYDEPSGIIDKTHWDTLFVQGTSIIMSHDVVSYICRHSHILLNYRVVDDVSIGIFLKSYMPNCLENIHYRPSMWNNSNRKKQKKLTTSFVFYRNKLQKSSLPSSSTEADSRHVYSSVVSETIQNTLIIGKTQGQLDTKEPSMILIQDHDTGNDSISNKRKRICYTECADRISSVLDLIPPPSSRPPPLKGVCDIINTSAHDEGNDDTRREDIIQMQQICDMLLFDR